MRRAGSSARRNSAARRTADERKGATMRIGCAAAARWIGNRCWGSTIAAVQRAMMQLQLHVAMQQGVDWDWSSARGVAWCSSHGASADACARCVRALRVSRQAVWCWVWQVKGTPFFWVASTHSHQLNTVFTPPLRRLLRRLGTATLATVDAARVGPRSLETEGSGSTFLGRYHSGIYRDSRVSRHTNDRSSSIERPPIESRRAHLA